MFFVSVPVPGNPIPVAHGKWTFFFYSLVKPIPPASSPVKPLPRYTYRPRPPTIKSAASDCVGG